VPAVQAGERPPAPVPKDSPSLAIKRGVHA
jgi:hypothetical protein